MQQQTKPSAKELLISWQQIWTRKLNGQNAGVKEAIASHAQLFPPGYQAEARIRAERIVAAHSGNPDSIRAFLKRGKATFRNA